MDQEESTVEVRSSTFFIRKLMLLTTTCNQVNGSMSVKSTPKSRRRSTLITASLKSTPKKLRKRSLSPHTSLKLLSRALIKDPQVSHNAPQHDSLLLDDSAHGQTHPFPTAIQTANSLTLTSVDTIGNPAEHINEDGNITDAPLNPMPSSQPNQTDPVLEKELLHSTNNLDNSMDSSAREGSYEIVPPQTANENILKGENIFHQDANDYLDFAEEDRDRVYMDEDPNIANGYSKDEDNEYNIQYYDSNPLYERTGEEEKMPQSDILLGEPTANEDHDHVSNPNEDEDLGGFKDGNKQDTSYDTTDNEGNTDSSYTSRHTPSSLLKRNHTPLQLKRPLSANADRIDPGHSDKTKLKISRKLLETWSTKIISNESLVTINKISLSYLKQLSDDVDAYSLHESKGRVNYRSLLMLFKRQRKARSFKEMIELCEDLFGLNEVLELEEFFKKT